MKREMGLALLSALCLYCGANRMCAQTGPVETRMSEAAAAQSAAADVAANGSVTGVVRDPQGAVVAGAKVELKGAGPGAVWTRETSREGQFVFDGLASGTYQATVTAAGFAAAAVRDVRVDAGKAALVDVTLRIAPAEAEVEVKAEGESAAATRRMIAVDEQAHSRNSGEMVAGAPGVSLRESGALAGVPALHGLGDERTKVVVEGATVESTCPNHMNPPLSYAAPAQAAAVTVLAGITPVSLGGDSLGGTVAVEERAPVFASGKEGIHEEGDATGFYRSNGEYYGGAVTEWVAGRHVALGYIGTWSTNDDYTDGNGHKVTSTYAQSTDHTVTLAAEAAGNLVTLEAGLHHTPYEGFVNAQMDLVRNYAERLNLHYRRALERGAVDAHVYWQGAWHSMNIGRDKSTFPMPMWMPMNTHGRDVGYTVKLELPLGARQTLRVGNELHHFRFDDVWPPVAGTAPMMGPDAFVSIDDGQRVRLGTYAEVASKWNAQWTTLFGVRNDTVWTNAGPVEGYSSMYSMNADAFNAANRAHTDPDVDATALARWEPNRASAYEFGYARKSRAPNLYERYAWSTNMMASGMIGWFGDGNYYVGNLALTPETANTVSGTARWRGAGEHAWEVRATPYLTYIENYVDVDTLATTMVGMSTFAQLQFANHDARIYGGDLDGSAVLWNSGRFEQGRLSGVGAWLHGERLDSSTPLYQMMPLNARVSFDEQVKGLAAGVGVEAVDRKRNVDPRRFEPQTPGYTLFNVHASYRKGAFVVSGGADNLLNKAYELPLGGVNLDDFMAGMQMGTIEPVTGRGRSGFISLSARF
jgi:iron complex outermembrane receptor protein